MIAFFREDWLRKIFFAIAIAPILGVWMTGGDGLVLVLVVAALIGGSGWTLRWVMDRSGWPADGSAIRRDAPLWHYVWMVPLIYLVLHFMLLTG